MARRHLRAGGDSLARPRSATPARPPERQLRADRDRFLAFAFAGGSLLLEVDGAGRIQTALGALTTLAGRPAEELIGRPAEALFVADDRPAFARALAHLAQAQQLLPLPLSLARPAGAPLRIALSGCRLPHHRGDCHLSLRPLAPGETLAARDPASGLLEREAFEALVRQHVRTDGQASDCQLSLLDLSGLEALRGRLPPAAAERVASGIGQSLRRFALGGGGAGLLEGERFGLLHDPGIALAEIQDHLVAAVRSFDPAGAGIEPRGATLELAAAGLSEADAGKALLYAINSFARASEGEFTLRTLRDGFEVMLQDTVARIADYRGALDSGAFQLAFQPIVSLADRVTVHHYEALSRTGDGTPIASMVSFAEELSMVAEFDMMVCRRVARLLASPAGAKASIAANVSGRSLECAAFAGALLAMLRDQPMIRGRMLFELTETAQVRDPAKVNRVMQELRRRGCRVCLDDFGSGAATFHYLRAFGVDFVKIDGSLVRSHDQRDHAVLRSVVALCRELKVATIAEMVETAEQARWLGRLKVSHGQGFLWGRPTPRLGHLAAGQAC
jgi:EAL domain-containing protein (putative c-di-GMP-specific phosphodiesterase class I)/PAS domain-containing protein